MKPIDSPGVPSPGDIERVFSFLTAEQCLALQPCIDLHCVKAGDVLFSAGDPADALFVLLEGQLAVKKKTGIGRNDQLIALLAPPAPVGEAALGRSGERRTTVRAVSDAILLRLETTSFRSLAANYPDLGMLLLRHLLGIACLRLEKCSARLAHVL